MNDTTRGKWAIITGASSGIGKALAFEFAGGGFNLVLTARDAEALEKVAGQCSAKYGIETEVIPADLADGHSIDRFVCNLKASPRRYEALVNNAGFGIHGDFVSTDIDRNIQLLNVQLVAALKLTQAVLGPMTSRGGGRILNVASVYSYSPVPLQSVYSACKAFLLSFSSSLQNELKGTGVTVTAFCPGVTQTEFRLRAGIREKSKGAGMTAEEAARVAYTQMMRGKHIVVPGLSNRLFVLLTRTLPQSSLPGFVRFINQRRGQSSIGETGDLLKAQPDKLKLLSQELMRVQETERRHIARELHDDIGQNLTAVTTHLQIVKASHPELASTMDDCVQTVERILKSVRDLSLDLRPPLIDEVGLDAALRWYVANQSGRSEGLSVEIQTSFEETRLPADMKLGVFRIVQEAVTNVVRHAKATGVWVSLNEIENYLEIKVEDNGTGFDGNSRRANLDQPPTLGLIGMEERARQFQGEFTIKSRAGAGSVVHVRLPLVT